MTTFVLVHGAWHGAWAWDGVASALREAGNTVVVPALSGAADGPLPTRTTGLLAHGDEVAEVLRQQPSAVTLVGHSYAGLVVRQAAAAVPHAVSELVLIDGWVGPSGKSLYDLAPSWFAASCDSAAAARGEGWLVPAPPPAMFGITDPAQAQLLQERLRPQPLATFTEPAAAVVDAHKLGGRAMVTTVGATMPFADLAVAAGYRVLELPTVHDAMIARPDLVAEALLSPEPL